MIIIGITGIIGSGKSTVSEMLRKKGFDVLDLDRTAHTVTESGDVIKKIEKVFGTRTLTNGKFDREKMKEIVFENKNALKNLEAIIHPEVRNAVFSTAEEMEKKGKKTFIIDGPLLFETGLYKEFHKTVVVSASMELIKTRLKHRGMEIQDVEKRIMFQIPLSEKEKLADYVVYNNGTEKDLENEVDKLIRLIRNWEVV